MLGCQHALRRSPRIAAIQGKQTQIDVKNEMDIDDVEEDKQSVTSEKSFMTDFTVIDNNDVHSLM